MTPRWDYAQKAVPHQAVLLDVVGDGVLNFRDLPEHIAQDGQALFKSFELHAQTRLHLVIVPAHYGGVIAEGAITTASNDGGGGARGAIGVTAGHRGIWAGDRIRVTDHRSTQ